MVVVVAVGSVLGVQIDCNSAFSLILRLLSIFLSVPKVMARDKSVRILDSGPYAAGTGGIARARVRSGAQNRAVSGDVQRCGCGCCGVDWGLQICSDTCVRTFMAGGGFHKNLTLGKIRGY